MEEAIKRKGANRPPTITIMNTEKMKCPIIRKCGGCSFYHDDYPYYLRTRQKQLQELLGEIALVQPILKMQNPYYYRNKVHGVFSVEKKQLIIGNYIEDSHKVIDVEHCLIEDERAQAIIRSLKKLIPSFKWPVYEEDSGRGFIRRVLIRVGKNSGEILVTLVVGSLVIPGKKNFIKALLKLHPEITSIVFNHNDRKTSMILGQNNSVAYGRGYIHDTLLDKTFRISVNSFYQVNTVQTEVLYKKATELAQLKKTDQVLDAYCGIGTIAICLSDQVNEVVGVEINKAAIRDAIENAKLNQVRNVRFYQDDAKNQLGYAADKGIHYNVIILDPPRQGSDPELLELINQSNTERVVYISCNPETLKRDLEILRKSYTVKTIQPVDMFPWTKHVETVVLMSRA